MVMESFVPNIIPNSGPVARPTSNTNPVPIGNSGGFNKFVNVLQTGKQVYDSLPPDKQQAVKEKIQQHAANIRDKVTRNKSGGSRPKGNMDKYSHSSGYALSKAPTPNNIKLDTGIQPNTYNLDFMEAVYNSCSPLHMVGVVFQFPNYSQSTLYNYFLNIIAFDIQTKAQANVGFNINVGTDLSPANILSAFNALVSALQTYFYFASIITYHSNPANKNAGMIFLRKNITPQVIEDLTLLERRLLDTPVPPKLFELIRYLSGTFYSGDTAGSPLIKFYPGTPTTTLIDTTAPSAALTLLNTTSNNQVFTLMRRAIPQWKPAVLYDVPTVPFYDANFKTIFANAPALSYYGGIGNFIPTVANSSTNIKYNSFTSALDGVAYALTSTYDSTALKWLPGLLVPSVNTIAGSTGSTRMSYYQNSTNTLDQFYSSDANTYLIRSRQDTYQLNDALNALLPIHLQGATLCQSVNQDTIKETCYKSIDYLMSLDTIKIDLKSKGGNKYTSKKRGK